MEIIGMRKVLAVTLVLGITTAANAVYIQVDGQVGPKAVVEPDTKALITVVSEDASSWLGYLIIEEGGSGELSNPVVLDAAGDMGYSDEPDCGLGYEIMAAMSQVGCIGLARPLRLLITSGAARWQQGRPTRRVSSIRTMFWLLAVDFWLGARFGLCSLGPRWRSGTISAAMG
jgi:hypothetical protein